MYPVYIQNNVVQINKGVSFFMAASWFFVLHSLCYTVALYRYSKMQRTTEKEVPISVEVMEAPVEECYNTYRAGRTAGRPPLSHAYFSLNLLTLLSLSVPLNVETKT
jgi:hypothetical protein